MEDYWWHLWSEIKPPAEDLLPSIGQRALMGGRGVDVRVYRIFNMVSLGARYAVELLVFMIIADILCKFCHHLNTLTLILCKNQRGKSRKMGFLGRHVLIKPYDLLPPAEKM